ncbi:MAG: hypothetical protein EOP49_37220 [Sphingobacteriales bacterium]|nr:MAG: hypothetical protein EOP49_37220 [Sphingobacteriales bacterium]
MLVILGICAWFAYRQYKDSKVFEAKASFIYIELQKKTYGEMLDKLQDMIEAKSYNRVADALSVAPEKARAIVSIAALNLYGSRLSEDITEKNQSFYVQVVAADAHVFDSLQYAIENYLNNNVLVKELVARKRKTLQEKITYQRSELAMLDSLKLAYTRSVAQSSGSAYPAATQMNPVPVYERGEKVLHDITEMEALLADYRAVQTQDRFLVTEQPVGKSATSIAIRYLAIFVLASIGLIFLISMFRK